VVIAVRRNVLFLSLVLAMCSVFCVRFNAVEVQAFDGVDTSKVYGVEMLWNNSMSVYDVAVSRDGKYIAAVNGSGLFYFDANSSSPRWWENPPTYFISVAISAEGEYVAVGTHEGRVYYWNDSRSRIGAPNSPTWGSIYMYGAIERGALDMSDDGDYVVVVGTDVNVWFYAGCTVRSGSDQPTTWVDYPESLVHVVDMSSDGRFVAAGGTPGTGGFVVFYKDTHNATSPPKLWHAQSSLPFPIWDIAVSDDGYAVAAITEFEYDYLHYWANATELSGDPNATWTGYGPFFSLTMSSTGDEVACGMGFPGPCGVHFWDEARLRLGANQTEDWIRFEGWIGWDVVMSNDGGIVAATVTNASSYKALFFRSDGALIGEFDLMQFSPLLSMSGDGGIIAVGGPGWDSLYVFGVLDDTTPPMIESVWQEPDHDEVTPEDAVMVYTNVTDSESWVKQVALHYSLDGETWFAVNMTKLTGATWNGTIPTFDYCTWINYTITAEDEVGNMITSVEEFGYQHQYHVIPEFPSLLIAPLFMVLTLLMIVVYRRKDAFMHY